MINTVDVWQEETFHPAVTHHLLSKRSLGYVLFVLLSLIYCVFLPVLSFFHVLRGFAIRLPLILIFLALYFFIKRMVQNYPGSDHISPT